MLGKFVHHGSSGSQALIGEVLFDGLSDLGLAATFQEEWKLLDDHSHADQRRFQVASLEVVVELLKSDHQPVQTILTVGRRKETVFAEERTVNPHLLIVDSFQLVEF